jgi:transcriptional regulator with XRE-family HTH domain
MRLVKNSTSIIKNREKSRTTLRKVWDRKKRDLGLTQVKVAQTLGIAQASFNQYLNGRIPLNTNFVLKIAEILEVEPGEISPELFKYVPLKTKIISVPVLFAIGGFKGACGEVKVTLAEQSKSAESSFAVFVNENMRSPLIPTGSYLVCNHIGTKDLRPTDFVWVIYEDPGEQKPNELLQILSLQKNSFVAMDPVTRTEKVVFTSKKADVHSISKVTAIQLPQ